MSIMRRLWWCIDPAYLVTRNSLEPVQAGKSARWKPKTIVEKVENEQANAMASGHEFSEKRPAGMEGVGRAKRIRDSKDIIL